MHDPIGGCKQVKDDWDSHWRRFGAAAELSPATRYRHSLALRLLEVRGPVRMLEIGSGTGQFAAEFRARAPGACYLGLELSVKAAGLAARRVPSARFMARDLMAAAPALDFRATHGLCSDVLEHLDDPALLLRHAAEYMAPGCKLVVTVPGGWCNAFYRHIGHRRHYTPAELKSLLESAGFRVDRTLAAGFPFFNLYRTLIAWRGETLIGEAEGPPSRLMRVLAACFNALFRLNLMHPWGWQTVAIAYKE